MHVSEAEVLQYGNNEVATGSGLRSRFFLGLTTWAGILDRSVRAFVRVRSVLRTTILIPVPRGTEGKELIYSTCMYMQYSLVPKSRSGSLVPPDQRLYT